MAGLPFWGLADMLPDGVCRAVVFAPVVRPIHESLWVAEATAPELVLVDPLEHRRPCDPLLKGHVGGASFLRMSANCTPPSRHRRSAST